MSTNHTKQIKTDEETNAENLGPGRYSDTSGSNTNRATKGAFCTTNGAFCAQADARKTLSPGISAINFFCDTKMFFFANKWNTSGKLSSLTA